MSSSPIQTCAWHHDRPAGVICQRCDRPICPSCMHQASVGFHCPDCTKKGAQRVQHGIGAIATRPVVTQALIGINIAVFVIGMLVSGNAGRYLSGSVTSFHIDFGLIARGCSAAIGNVCVGTVGVGDGEWYRIVTSGFLHYGLIHILVNMYALWVLGSAVEQMGGRAKLGVVYGVALLAGAFGALLLSPGDLTAGASGAIYGLMGAIFLAMRARGIPFRNSPLLGVLLLNLILTVGLNGISLGGHVGGLIGGGIAGWVLFDYANQPNVNVKVPWVICAAVGLALVVGSVLVSNGASLG